MTENTSKRAIISLTTDDVARLIECTADEYWSAFYQSIYNVMTSETPVHFTDLGTTP